MEDTRTTIVAGKTMQKQGSDCLKIEEIVFHKNICANPPVSVPYTNNKLKMMIQLETKKSPRNEAKDVLENKVKLLFLSFVNVKRRALPNESAWLTYVYQMARWTKDNLEKMNDPIGNDWQLLSIRQRVVKALEEGDSSNFQQFRQQYDIVLRNNLVESNRMNAEHN